jgi:hypothetical protein
MIDQRDTQLQGIFYTYTFTSQVEIVAFELTEYLQELPKESRKLFSELIIIRDVCSPLGKTGLPKTSG